MTLPGYEEIEARSVAERAALVAEWSDWFYAAADSFEGQIGLQLAYLWPAIIKANKIEVEEHSEIVSLLRAEGVPDDATIWQYLDVVESEESSSETCRNCLDGPHGCCPLCFAATGLGCPHGDLCDGCKADLQKTKE